jgi:hypothetical protein
MPKISSTLLTIRKRRFVRHPALKQYGFVIVRTVLFGTLSGISLVKNYLRDL